jgi:hypothetical protein
VGESGEVDVGVWKAKREEERTRLFRSRRVRISGRVRWEMSSAPFGPGREGRERRGGGGIS